MTAWFEMRPVGLGFLVDGPMRFEVAVQTSLSREQCWGAFTDAAGWSSWFPGVREAGYREQALPYGVGTIRTAVVWGVLFVDTILAWDEPEVCIYRIDRCTAEVATAQVEATLFEERPGGGTRVVWRLASDPCPPMAAAARVSTPVSRMRS
jgi:uncharacterized protein YndB with AHSA1/START domain